jgi:tRNA-Thr(GGU) m(6)t(6)A37 methyltransferase TsaA
MRSKNEIHFSPIGIIHTPYTSLDMLPNRPDRRSSATGAAEVFPQFAPGLKDLDGFSHVYLIFHLHLVASPELTVSPLNDGVTRGVFATRAPRRPNPIGLTLARLLSIEGSTLHLDGLDMLDGTPLLDIKPYTPGDRPRRARFGWLAGIRATGKS